MLSARILRNSTWNALGYVWLAGVLFLLIPYIVHRIGAEAYGVWTLVLVVTGYSTLLDFGMGSALVKYVAEYSSSGDPRHVNKVVNNGLLFFLGFALLVVALMLPLTGPFVRLFRVPEAMRESARLAFRIGIGTFALNTILMVALSVMTGLQRMDLSNLVKVAMTVPRAVGIVIVLRAGRGLIGLLTVDMAVAVVSIVFAALIVRRLLPQLVLGARYLDREVFRRMFRFGVRLQASSVAEIVNLHLDKLLISRFIGVPEVTSYEVGSYVIARLRTFLAMVPSSLVPAVAELDAKDDPATVRRLHLTGSKYVAYAASLAFGMLILTAPHLYRFWMGQGFERSARTMQILGLGYYMNVITVVTAYTAQGIGRPGYQMRTAIWQVVANAVLSPILILTIGFYGGPVGTAIALISGAIFFTVTFLRAMKGNGPVYLARVLGKPVVAVALGAAAVLAMRAAAPGWMDAADPRGLAFRRWVVEAALFGAIYLGALRVLRYFAREETAPIRDHLRALVGTRAGFSTGA